MEFMDQTRRMALAAGYWLKPARIRDAPHLVAGMASSLLSRSKAVPALSDIRERPSGFAGLAFDPDTPTVLEAARRGFYPYSHFGPMGWWSPPMRGAMLLKDVHIAKRFRRTLKKTELTVTIDTAFEDVLNGCAAPRPGRPRLTWLTPAAKALYSRLHRQGHAHSVEVWKGEGKLVAGLFGVDVAPVFSALSMFHTEDDASKIAIVSLYHHLAAWGYQAVDHQTLSGWVRDLGGIEMPRQAYIDLLETPHERGAAQWKAIFTPAETAIWEAGEVPATKA
ncbi:leucyl/phenylalanyl-tRNA--protein transferase [Aliihoeflea sp. PC F10.4]